MCAISKLSSLSFLRINGQNITPYKLQSILQVSMAYCIPTSKRTQNNPMLEKKLSHGTIWLLFLYPFVKPIIIFYQIACSTSSPRAPYYNSILCTYLNLALTKHQIFISYQHGLAFMYCQMGKYLSQYLIIILSTNVLCFTFQNGSHRSLWALTIHLIFAIL